MSVQPVRVCFFSPLLWPVWSGGAVPFAGGAEMQQARLARGLAARGFDVTVVTCDFGQPSPVTVDGVRVLKTYRRESGVPVLRFFHPRLSRSVAALRAAAAHVYYVRAAGLEAGIAFDVARSLGAAFVFAAAHDHDARRALPPLGNPRDRWWYARAARSGRGHRPVRGAARAVSPGVESRVRGGAQPRRAAVLGRTPHGHRRGVALDLQGRQAPGVVHGARARVAGAAIRHGGRGAPPARPGRGMGGRASRLRELPNLEVRGFADPAGVSELLRGAALFVHTSPAEGFPNTLLEAWAHGVPGVSCVDPDGVVAREGLGEQVADREGLVRAVGTWMADPARRRAAGERARAYAARAHSPAATIEALARILGRAAGARPRTSGRG